MCRGRILIAEHLQQYNMAEEIVLKVDVELEEGSKSLRSLKQEFKETQKQLEGLTVGSQKYIDTLKKLGGIRDDIGDLNQTINAFNPEGKVQALGNAIGGVASGFQTATAATALFGTENEELTKTLVKVQSAMALTDGIKGIVAMKDSFTVLNAVIAANPFIAIATAIIAAIALISAAINNQNEEEEKLNKKREERHREQMKRLQKEHEDAMDYTLEIMKARGASDKELYEAEKNLIKQRLEENRLMMVGKAIHAQEYYEKEEELNKKLTLLNLNHKRVVEETETKKREEYSKTIKKKEEVIDKDWEEAQAWLENASIRELKQKEIDDKISEEKRKQREKDSEENDKWLADEAAKQQKANDDEAAQEDRKNKDAIAAMSARQQMEKDAFAATQALSDIVYLSKLNNVQKGSVEEQKILKRQFEVNKAFQIGNALMNGAQGIQLAWATIPDPTGITQAIRTA